MSSEAISQDLKKAMRRLKLSPMLATLPERLTLARQQHMPHQDFLELVLSDEVERRDRLSAVNRSRKARLDPTMTLEAWDESTKVTYDRALWAELVTLRFMEDSNNAVVMGPVGTP